MGLIMDEKSVDRLWTSGDCLSLDVFVDFEERKLPTLVIDGSLTGLLTESVCSVEI